MPDPDQREAEEARLLARARERLAREVHDELTHRVARISMQVMGHRDTDDVHELRRAMDTVAAATAGIRADLWLLDRVLSADPGSEATADAGGAPMTGLPRLRVCEPVSTVVWRQVEAWRERGFDVDAVVDVPPAAEVGPLARGTLEEAVTTAGRVIEEHGTSGGQCVVEADASPGSVSLRVSAPVPGWSGEEDDPDLVALRERVRLMRGSLWTEHQQHSTRGTWSLILRLQEG